MEYRFMVTGGGTSGHINPAITIADALKAYYEGKGDTCKIIFTGREAGLEGELVPKAGYEFHNVEAKPFPMRPSPKMVAAALAIPKGKSQAKKLIKEFKPHGVIATGGYACVPLVMAAKSAGIPIMLHEANAFPGRANKTMARGAALVMTGFPGQEETFPYASKVICTGNPVRQMMFGNDPALCRKELGVKEDEKLVFAMGGSLGAVTISDFIVAAAKDSELSKVKFVLCAGKQHYGELDDVANEISNLEVIPYCDKPNVYMAAADVSVLRAGAVTCAELCAVGACGILIPYPHAAHDHQSYNAECIRKDNGCMVMKDSDVAEGKLLPVLKELLDNKEKQIELRLGAAAQAVPDTTDRIVNAIDEVIKANN